jgi:hypothetical protein
MMKHNKMTDHQLSKFLVLVAAATLGLCLTACTTTAPAPEPQAEPPVVEPIVIEPWDGDGMDIPLDGSSLEAFERSLARVEAHTTPSDYTTLVDAIDYLLVYDLGANRDRATLASRLDGLTGNQVVGKVGWRKPKR